MGSYDSSIKYMDLDDEMRQVETSKKLTETDVPSSFFDIKTLRQEVGISQIITNCTDGFLRKLEVTFDEMCPGVYSASFIENWKYKTVDCFTFEMQSDEVLVFGGKNAVYRYSLEKKISKEIKINSTPNNIKKFSPNLFAVASGKNIDLIDSRSDCVVQNFHYITKELRCLEVLGEH